MAVKQLAFDQEAREGLRQGVRTLARALRVTLGPRGRCVIIEKSFGSPTVANDGVTVAKEVEVEDKYANMGVQLVKEVATKTNDQVDVGFAGDGLGAVDVIGCGIGMNVVIDGNFETRGLEGVDGVFFVTRLSETFVGDEKDPATAALQRQFPQPIDRARTEDNPRSRIVIER